MGLSRDLSEVRTSKAPPPVGPYSQAIRMGDLLFCSGQIPLDPSGQQMVGKTAEEQAHQVLKNLSAVLTEAGLGLHRVVKTTIFLTDLQSFAVVNEVYKHYFGDHRPARSTVEVSGLPKGALVEIECIAAFE